jgi:hypothetical protein
MNRATLYCPHCHCRGGGKPFAQGYVVKNGTSRSRPVELGHRVRGDP